MIIKIEIYHIQNNLIISFIILFYCNFNYEYQLLNEYNNKCLRFSIVQFIDKCTNVLCCDFGMVRASIKRKTLTILDKLNILKKYDDGCAGKQKNQREIADELGFLPFT